MKNIIDRKATLVINLEKTAKEFGYKIEVDSFDDVSHSGYSAKDIRKMGIMLPKELEDVDQLFPSQVAMALEDCERDAYASAMRKERIEALKDALEKIDLIGGGAEYIDSENNSISAKAGILSAQIDTAAETITLEILNPEHLINSIVNGMGRFYPELSAFEPASNEELIANIHHLKDYFTVYGESKPSGDLSSQYTPGIDDEFFKDSIKERIQELSLESVAECVLDYAESESEEGIENKAINLAVKHTEFKKEDLKKLILSELAEKVSAWDKV